VDWPIGDDGKIEEDGTETKQLQRWGSRRKTKHQTAEATSCGVLKRRESMMSIRWSEERKGTSM
jgi:hypothetical protein